MSIRDAVNRQSTTDSTGPRCTGKSWAFTAYQYRDTEHRAGTVHPQCPHCGALLGCSRCAGPWHEVVCTRCVSWVSLDAFCRHGPILNTPIMRQRRGGKMARTLAEYPELWQRRYRQALADEPPIAPAVVEDVVRRFAP